MTGLGERLLLFSYACPGYAVKWPLVIMDRGGRLAVLGYCLKIERSDFPRSCCRYYASVA